MHLNRDIPHYGFQNPIPRSTRPFSEIEKKCAKERSSVGWGERDRLGFGVESGVNVRVSH